MAGARGAIFRRQWGIYCLLQRHYYGLSAREIAKEMETNIRTIYRDLDVLSSAGIPIYQDRDGKNSRWRLLAAKRG